MTGDTVGGDDAVVHLNRCPLSSRLIMAGSTVRLCGQMPLRFSSGNCIVMTSKTLVYYDWLMNKLEIIILGIKMTLIARQGSDYMPFRFFNLQCTFYYRTDSAPCQLNTREKGSRKYQY